MLYVSRKEHFNAAHKLYNPAWSKERNEQVFGPCANENWHGHNFDLIVTIRGMPDPETGFVVDLKKLSTMIRREVVNKLDHKNLNVDVDFMKDKLASCENLVVEIWRILEQNLPGVTRSGKLHSIRLYETPRNYVEYFGDQRSVHSPQSMVHGGADLSTIDFSSDSAIDHGPWTIDFFMRYYIIAGERSGDLHGSNLVKEIRKLDPGAVFRALGGDYLRNAGVDLFAHYAEFAVMGFVEVLLNIIKISGYLRKCGRDIENFKADVVILIDYAGFNRQMARFGKRNNIRVFYYISPKVWAWNQGRARQLKANVDRMFVILPFETDFYRKFNWEVDYVGNPVLDAVKAHKRDEAFLSRTGLNANSPIVALLPGSRKQELLSIVPVMKAVIQKFPDYQFAVATVNNLPPGLYDTLTGFYNVKLVEEDTYNLLLHANAAIVTSGTATLETALLRVPQIVVYKTGGMSYALAKMVVQVPFISLVNLIAGKEVVKEFIQGDATLANISVELKGLLAMGSYRARMLSEYDEVIRQLDAGGSASENAARLMIKYLDRGLGG